jgi:hypothetical protein
MVILIFAKDGERVTAQARRSRAFHVILSPYDLSVSPFTGNPSQSHLNTKPNPGRVWFPFQTNVVFNALDLTRALLMLFDLSRKDSEAQFSDKH